MKFILISILLFCSTNVAGMDVIQQQQVQVQQNYLQQTIYQCNYQLGQLQQQILFAQARGDAQSYNYLVWQYQGLKNQCDIEVLKIQSGYYNQGQQGQ